MSTLATLVVKLIGDAGGFSETMKTAEDIAQTAGGSISSKLGKGLGDLGKLAAGAIVGGATAAVGAMGASLVAATKWADKLDSIGDVLGTSANDSAALAIAFQRVGGNVEDMTAQMGKFTTGLFDAKGELGPTGTVLKNWGISFRDANGHMLPTTDILKNVSKVVASLPDGLQKTDLMMSLFGKSGKDLSDVMDSLAHGGLEAAGKQAKQFGLAIGEDGVNRAIEMKKSMADLGTAFQGIAVTVGSQLLPILVPLIQQFAGWVSSVMPDVRNAIEGVGKSLGTGSGGLSERIGGVVAFVQTNWPMVRMTFNDVFNAVKGFIENTLAPALQFIIARAGDVINWVRTNWPQIRQIAESVFAAIKGFVETVLVPAFNFIVKEAGKVVAWVTENWPLIKQTAETIFNAVKKVVETVVKWISDNWPQISKVIGDVFTAVKNIIEGAVSVFAGIIKTAMQIINGDWTGAWESIKAVFGTIWDGIKSAFELAMQFIGTLLGRIVEDIRNKWDASLKFLVSIGDKIWQAIQNAWNSVLTSVRNALAMVGTVIENTWDNIKQGVSEFGSKLWAAAQRVWNTLVTDASSLPQKFLDFGRRIIEGLVDGIRNAAEQAWAAIRYVAEGIVYVIQHNFGIQSPSKLFMGFGANMMQGLANGIIDSAHLPQRALDGVTTDMNFSDFSANGVAAASAGGSMNSRSYTLNVNNAGAPANVLGDFALLQALGG